MKKYPKMKDSEIEWIGEIPDDWRIEPLKFHVLVNQKTLDENTPPLQKIFYMDIGSVHEGGIIDTPETLEYFEAPSRARRIVTENDTILSTVRTYLKAIAFIDKKNQNNICSTGFAVISPKKELIPKFLYQILSSKKYIETIMANSYGVTYPAINSSIIGTFPCIIPKVHEQKQISEFLEQKIEKINSKISKNEKLIKKLHEKKQAIITHSVTKGLDPSVLMKDSEIEWIEETPEHWKFYRLKYIFDTIQNGIWGENPIGNENDIICIRVADFNRTNHSIHLNNPTVRNISSDEKTKHHLKKGDILLERSGGGEKQPVGFTVIYENDIDAVCSNFISKLRPKNDFNSNFLNYFFSARYMNRENIKYIKQTTGIQNLDLDYLSQIYSLPSLNEQKKISRFLDDVTEQIDLLILKSKNQKEKLYEFKQSLISLVITGKIDVREAIA